MNNHLSIISIIVIIVAVFVLINFIDADPEATYVRSHRGNKEYLVQNLDDKHDAASMLEEIEYKITVFCSHLKSNINNYPKFKPYIVQLNTRIKGCKIYENAPDGKYTSFTTDKGREIALCLRSKKVLQFGKLHDINIITYVLLHELAHVACPETGHTPLFKRIFAFFIKEADKIGIYHIENYIVHPREYCGMTIKEYLV